MNAGASLDLQDEKGNTAVSLAVLFEWSEPLRLLLEASADPLLENYQGLHAVDIANERRDVECAAILAELAAHDHDRQLRSATGLDSLRRRLGRGVDLLSTRVRGACACTHTLGRPRKQQTTHGLRPRYPHGVDSYTWAVAGRLAGMQVCRYAGMQVCVLALPRSAGPNLSTTAFGMCRVLRLVTPCLSKAAASCRSGGPLSLSLSPPLSLPLSLLSLYSLPSPSSLPLSSLSVDELTAAEAPRHPLWVTASSFIWGSSFGAPRAPRPGVPSRPGQKSVQNQGNRGVPASRPAQPIK